MINIMIIVNTKTIYSVDMVSACCNKVVKSQQSFSIHERKCKPHQWNELNASERKHAAFLNEAISVDILYF